MSTSTVKIAQGAIVSQDAKITGDVRIGAGTIIHPRCEIKAEGGPIIIGENNVIEEYVLIRSSSPQGIKIGSSNVFEVGAQVFSSSIGNANVIESKAILNASSTVGDGCVVTAKLTLDNELPNDTVLFGSGNSRRTSATVSEGHLALHSKHLEILAKIFPAHFPQAK